VKILLQKNHPTTQKRSTREIRRTALSENQTGGEVELLNRQRGGFFPFLEGSVPQKKEEFQVPSPERGVSHEEILGAGGGGSPHQKPTSFLEKRSLAKKTRGDIRKDVIFLSYGLKKVRETPQRERGERGAEGGGSNGERLSNLKEGHFVEGERRGQIIGGESIEKGQHHELQK